MDKSDFLQKLKNTLDLYNNDYSKFVDYYKLELEPKLLFLAECRNLSFVKSNNPKLIPDGRLSPPGLLAVDDDGHELPFVCEFLVWSIDEIKDLHGQFKLEY